MDKLYLLEITPLARGELRDVVECNNYKIELAFLCGTVRVEGTLL